MPSGVIGEADEARVKHVFPAAGESALVAAAQSGDVRAFEILVGRYQRRIFAVAMRFGRVREDAEDIAQQSFQKAFIHLCSFQGNSSFSTWLTRIAINEALMWLRRKRAAHEVPLEQASVNDETAQPPEYRDSGPNPEDRYLKQEQSRIVSSAVKQLNPRMRKAIELRELGELSTEETAQALRVSIGAVKARVFHGRKKLREALARYVEPTGTRRNQALQGKGKANGSA